MTLKVPALGRRRTTILVGVSPSPPEEIAANSALALSSHSALLRKSSLWNLALNCGSDVSLAKHLSF